MLDVVVLLLLVWVGQQRLLEVAVAAGCGGGKGAAAGLTGAEMAMQELPSVGQQAAVPQPWRLAAGLQRRLCQPRLHCRKAALVDASK